MDDDLLQANVQIGVLIASSSCWGSKCWLNSGLQVDQQVAIYCMMDLALSPPHYRRQYSPLTE